MNPWLAEFLDALVRVDHATDRKVWLLQLREHGSPEVRAEAFLRLYWTTGDRLIEPAKHVMHG